MLSKQFSMLRSHYGRNEEHADGQPFSTLICDVAQSGGTRVCPLEYMLT